MSDCDHCMRKPHCNIDKNAEKLCIKQNYLFFLPLYNKGD